MKLTQQEQQTIDAYNRNATVWAASRNRAHVWQEEKDTFKKYLAQGKLLEIGSGGGRDARDLIAAGYDYTGTDISEGLLAEAKKNSPQATFLLQSVYALDFSQATFDGFWACAVLLHMPKDRMNEALQSIRKVMKKGGIGFISLKKGEGERFVQGDHTGNIQYERFFSFWQEEEFKKVLQDNHFAILESYETQQANKPWLVFFVRAV